MNASILTKIDEKIFAYLLINHTYFYMSATTAMSKHASVTYVIDDYDSVSITIKYHQMEFTYMFADSYLEQWERTIKRHESQKQLRLDSGDTQSWQDQLGVVFPNSVRKLYIEVLKSIVAEFEKRIDNE